jgi:hypothetical protein
MKQLCTLAVLGTFSSAVLLAGGDELCPRCEEIREYNKAHHHNYEYFEDYQKDEGKSSSTESEPKERSQESEKANESQKYQKKNGQTSKPATSPRKPATNQIVPR